MSIQPSKKLPPMPMRRYACDVLDELRSCHKTRSYTMVLALTEELQVMFLRMEDALGLYADEQGDLGYVEKRIEKLKKDKKKLQKEIRELKKKKKDLGGKDDEDK